MDARTQQNILDTFAGVDLSIIEEVLYFDGWMSYEESGGYLIFKGIDGSIQRCEYGYSVMADDNTNHFEPMDITHEEYLRCVKEMDETSNRMEY